MLQGTLTAMITPFNAQGIDAPRLRQQVEAQLDAGVQGLVPAGTTGESPTLSHDEHRRLIADVVQIVAGRATVVAGTGSNSTSEALDLTRHAHNVGADAALVVNPYYNKPTQEGLYRHFMAIADSVDLPIVLYNIPGRCGVALTAATVARLAEHENIVAIKEATGSMDMASEIRHLCDITLLSGDDSLTLPLMALGGTGVISVLSNLVPQRVRSLTDAMLSGDFEQARMLHFKLFPLFRAMFMETNPIPIKTAMALADHDSGELRLPLCEMDDARREQLAQLLKDEKVI